MSKITLVEISSRLVHACMGFSGRNAEVAKNEFVKHKLVQEVEVVSGRRRSVKFLVITDLGLIRKRDIGEEIRLWDYIGHVSFEHRLSEFWSPILTEMRIIKLSSRRTLVKRLCQLMQRSVRKEVKKELNDIRQRIYEVRNPKAKDERSADMLSYCEVWFWGD